ncbi:MAG: hypothetical protein MK111_00645 [Crocosphaera sp.]|nr:hypothetical protein [Crocosphaera sp.]MCH2243148.1 hypothetical protein [Crocosphaera sp.]
MNSNQYHLNLQEKITNHRAVVDLNVWEVLDAGNTKPFCIMPLEMS